MKKIMTLFLALSLHLSAFDSSINLYSGRGISESLPDTLTNLINSGVHLRDTYLYSISYTETFYDVTEHIYLGYEFDLAKHTGLQENIEVDAGALILFKEILPDNDFIDFDLIWGIGLSHAIGTPSFDDGPWDDPTRRYATLLFIVSDFDIYLSQYPEFHFFLRKHHRSGAYGLVAPEHVGSNFVGYGIKYQF